MTERRSTVSYDKGPAALWLVRMDFSEAVRVVAERSVEFVMWRTVGAEGASVLGFCFERCAVYQLNLNQLIIVVELIAFLPFHGPAGMPEMIVKVVKMFRHFIVLFLLDKAQDSIDLCAINTFISLFPQQCYFPSYWLLFLINLCLTSKV